MPESAGPLPHGSRPATIADAWRIAEAFHGAYEHNAPAFGYRTREASAKPWPEVPAENRKLMAQTVLDLLDEGVIQPAPSPGVRAELPDDVKRNTYTADREPGLHAKGLPGAPASEVEGRDCTCGMTNGAGVAEDPKCPKHGAAVAGETDQRWVIYRDVIAGRTSDWRVAITPGHAEAVFHEPTREAIEVRPQSTLDRALRERDEAREALDDALNRVHEHRCPAGICESCNTISRLQAELSAALRAAGSEEENR